MCVHANVHALPWTDSLTTWSKSPTIKCFLQFNVRLLCNWSNANSAGNLMEIHETCRARQPGLELTLHKTASYSGLTPHSSRLNPLVYTRIWILACVHVIVCVFTHKRELVYVTAVSLFVGEKWVLLYGLFSRVLVLMPLKIAVAPFR